MRKQNKKQKFAERFEQSSQNFSEINQPETNNVDGKPIQLIRIRPTGKIEICQDALEMIESVDDPVGFVSLVGKMRTGKSCLLNRILHLSGQGFKVDPSTSSCTEGIWMWSQPYMNQSSKNLIFFLDTQGTDSFSKDIENDTKIFTLSVLISSFFIYNSIGSIDQRSLNDIQMVTALSKQIKIGDQGMASGNSAQLHKYMPKFLWLLRDFMLNIQDQRGKKISPSQYLENCLTEQNSIGKASQESKKIKKSIMTFFPERQCLTLVRPVDDEEDLQKLNQLPDHRLRKGFTDGIRELRQKIIKNTGPKTYEGQPITGSQMATMIKSYVQSFNSGKVPNIKTAWQQITDDEGRDAYNKGLQKFNELFNNQFASGEPKGEQIYRLISKMKEQSLEQFKKNSLNNDNHQHYVKLKGLLDDKEKEILEQNNNVNQSKNTEILNNLSKKLRTRIESNYYLGNNKKEELEQDIQEIANTYKQKAKGEKKGDLLTEFLTTLMPMVTSMKADNTEELEKIRLADIAMNEKNQRIKALELENQSKAKQIKSKQNASKLKSGSAAKNSQRQAQKSDKGGCCAGKSCEIM